MSQNDNPIPSPRGSLPELQRIGQSNPARISNPRLGDTDSSGFLVRKGWENNGEAHDADFLAGDGAVTICVEPGEDVEFVIDVTEKNSILGFIFDNWCSLALLGALGYILYMHRKALSRGLFKLARGLGLTSKNGFGGLGGLGGWGGKGFRKNIRFEDYPSKCNPSTMSPAICREICRRN